MTFVRKSDGEILPIKVVIPYYLGDKGARPLPSGIAEWFCPSLDISPLDPDGKVDVSVTVANFGTTTATATVNVKIYSEDFLGKRQFAQNFTGLQGALAVPSNGGQRKVVFRGVEPALLGTLGRGGERPTDIQFGTMASWRWLPVRVTSRRITIR